MVDERNNQMGCHWMQMEYPLPNCIAWEKSIFDATYKNSTKAKVGKPITYHQTKDYAYTMEIQDHVRPCGQPVGGSDL